MLVFLSFQVLVQEDKQPIKSGSILLKNIDTVHFTNLRYEDEKVIYTNSQAQLTEHLYLNSIIEIKEITAYTPEEIQSIQNKEIKENFTLKDDVYYSINDLYEGKSYKHKRTLKVNKPKCSSVFARNQNS